MAGLFAAAAARLLPIVRQAGAGLLARLVEGRGPIVETIGTAIAERLGVDPTPAAIEEAWSHNPDPVAEAVRAVENDRSPAEWQQLAAELEAKRELLAREDDRETPFAWAWRPFWMWLLALFWAWTVILAPVLRMLTGHDLSGVDVGTLLALSGLYAGFYMGGHTIKAIAESRWGGR